MGSCVFIYCLKYLRGRETSTIFLPDHSLLLITGGSLGERQQSHSPDFFVSLASAHLLQVYVVFRASKSKRFQRAMFSLKGQNSSFSATSQGDLFMNVTWPLFTSQMSVISIFIIVILQPGCHHWCFGVVSISFFWSERTSQLNVLKRDVKACVCKKDSPTMKTNGLWTPRQLWAVLCNGPVCAPELATVTWGHVELLHCKPLHHPPLTGFTVVPHKLFWVGGTDEGWSALPLGVCVWANSWICSQDPPAAFSSLLSPRSDILHHRVSFCICVEVTGEQYYA